MKKIIQIIYVKGGSAPISLYMYMQCDIWMRPSSKQQAMVHDHVRRRSRRVTYSCVASFPFVLVFKNYFLGWLVNIVNLNLVWY